ncbi:MAG: hypothetical protein Q7T05_02240 [Dehalococcoidia bacterium]|nr:hypothetical protein [Dehalococcoidia bacterium]
MESEDIEKVVEALRSVPEQKLLLIELANKVAVRKGDLDYQQLQAIQPEVHLALSQAQAYAAETAKALQALINLKALEE